MQDHRDGSFGAKSKVCYILSEVINMPRQARRKSETGIYHIVKRGIKRQEVFQDDEDKHIYLQRLLSYKNECGFEVYAYCLMDNHIHLLLKEGAEDMSEAMKKIGVSYVYRYNWKYNRVGNLFQDRYKSEPVEDEKYLLTVLRYIHQNPVKIGLGIDHWTSYNDYIGNTRLTDIKPILALFNHNEEVARKEYKKYMATPCDADCLDISVRTRITDIEAREIAKRLGISNLQELQQMDKDKRGTVLRYLKEEGLTGRQLERLTGVGRGIILRA